MPESQVLHEQIKICRHCNRQIARCSKCSKAFEFDEEIDCDFRKHYCKNCKG